MGGAPNGSFPKVSSKMLELAAGVGFVGAGVRLGVKAASKNPAAGAGVRPGTTATAGEDSRGTDFDGPEDKIIHSKCSYQNCTPISINYILE